MIPNPLLSILPVAGILLALLIAVASWARKKAGVNLVITRWFASNVPDEEGRHISIEGRTGGVIMWVLEKAGVDTRSGISVSDVSLKFTEHSLAGPKVRFIPLSSISSIFFEYHNPWIASLVVLAVVSRIGSVLRWISGQFGTYGDQFGGVQIIGWVLGILFALFYYFLNRKLTLGVVEHSGIGIKIQFKRSVIENQEINQEQANYVCQLIQGLIENERLSGKLDPEGAE